MECKRCIEVRIKSGYENAVCGDCVAMQFSSDLVKITTQRNKLNRQISTLKKAMPKETEGINICQYCGVRWESYNDEQDCCCECWDEGIRQGLQQPLTN